MNAKIEGGLLCVNIADLIDSLGDADRLQIIEQLSCHDQIITNVAAQIVEGWTEEGNHGFTSYGPLPHTPLDKAKSFLAQSASAVAKSEIEKLQAMAEHYKKGRDEEMTKRVEAEHKLWRLKSEAG